MKDIVWDWVLSVDYPEIDEDHKKLINTFNVLNHAVSEGDSHEYLAAVMEELINCTVWHFSHEERLMLSSLPQAFALERHSGLDMPLKLTRQESRSQSWAYAYVL